MKRDTQGAERTAGILLQALESREPAERGPVLDEVREAVNGFGRLETVGSSAGRAMRTRQRLVESVLRVGFGFELRASTQRKIGSSALSLVPSASSAAIKLPPGV